MVTAGIPEAEPWSDFLEDRDRGAYWAGLRTLGVVQDSRGPGFPIYLTRRDDVLTALCDPEVFKPAAYPFQVTMPDGRQLRPVPLSLSPTDHARFAQALYRVFTARALAPFSEAIRAHARYLTTAVAPTGRCEAVHDDLVPLFVHGTLLIVCGVGLAYWPAITALMRNPAFESDGTVQHRLLQYLVAGLSRGYRQRPGILWDLIDSVDDGSSLSNTELYGLLLLFHPASQSAVDAIQFGLWRLARDAQLQRQIRKDPALVGRFVEEVVRLSGGSAVSGHRITTREITIGNVTLPAHTTVGLCLESASRQESGDEFSITSKPRRHWGFGGGIHRCLGAHLARLQMKIFIEEWLRQIPEFQLEPDCQLAADDLGTLAALPLIWKSK